MPERVHRAMLWMLAEQLLEELGDASCTIHENRPMVSTRPKSTRLNARRKKIEGEAAKGGVTVRHRVCYSSPRLVTMGPRLRLVR